MGLSYIATDFLSRLDTSLSSFLHNFPFIVNHFVTFNWLSKPTAMLFWPSQIPSWSGQCSIFNVRWLWLGHQSQSLLDQVSVQSRQCLRWAFGTVSIPSWSGQCSIETDVYDELLVRSQSLLDQVSVQSWAARDAARDAASQSLLDQVSVQSYSQLGSRSVASQSLLDQVSVQSASPARLQWWQGLNPFLIRSVFNREVWGLSRERKVSIPSWSGQCSIPYPCEYW